MHTPVTIHMITGLFPPTMGGLESWTEELASRLHREGMTPIVYVCDERGAREPLAEQAFETVDIAALRRPWIAPLKHPKCPPEKFRQERSRMNFACLRCEVGKRRGSGRNLILSNSATLAGFDARLVAEAVGWPHIVTVTGTDFSRDYRSKLDRQAFIDVCRSAGFIVTKSLEQLSSASRYATSQTRVIETSVPSPDEYWSKPPREGITIFSDAGFSSKKGTGVLLDACTELSRTGMSLSLVLCGGDQYGEEEYWLERRHEIGSVEGLHALFPGHVDSKQILELMREADIYASASLGEGCSAGRAFALCFGIPMISTLCGELAVDPILSHVRLVPVADAIGFHRGLQELILDLVHDRVRIDRSSIDAFRARFSPEREWRSWVEVVREVASR